MPSTCIISLTTPSEIFFAGDQIKGTVELTTSKPKNVKRIKIRLRGTIVCAFGVSVSTTQVGTGRVRYHSVEKLIKRDQYVFGDDILAPGKYTWQFCFVVDETWPTSMESRRGHIRYCVSLKIYNEHKYNNVFVKPITVIKINDLNKRRDELQREETVLSATFCCRYIRCGPDVKITKIYRGYAPGQLVTYALDLSYKIPGKQYDLEILFYRRTIFKANNPVTIESILDTVFYFSRPETATAYDVQHIEDSFFIPATAPTTTTRFITVQYFFKVKLKLKCCPFAFQELIPIEIGTVPLKDTLRPLQQQYLVEFRPGEFIMTPKRFEESGGYDSTFINEKELRINRVDDFLPKYPMFPP